MGAFGRTDSSEGHQGFGREDQRVGAGLQKEVGSDHKGS